MSSAAEIENWSVPIKLTVNGVEHAATVEPRTLLVYFLRDNLGLTGTHVGCDTSQCGIPAPRRRCVRAPGRRRGGTSVRGIAPRGRGRNIDTTAIEHRHAPTSDEGIP